MATISKTLRLTPETIEKINSFKGDTFAAKFAVMVDLVYTRREALTKEIKALQDEKSRLAAEVADFQVVIDYSLRLAAKLNNISWSLNECKRMSDGMQKCMARISGQDLKPPD